MEYIVFIHKNTDTLTTEAQWSSFFSPARKGGVFLGGSEISNQIQMGEKSVTNITNSIGGVMRFESKDKAEVLAVQNHPVFI